MKISKLKTVLLIAGAIGGLHIGFNLLKPIVEPESRKSKSREKLMEELRNKIEKGKL